MRQFFPRPHDLIRRGTAEAASDRDERSPAGQHPRGTPGSVPATAKRRSAPMCDDGATPYVRANLDEGGRGMTPQRFNRGVFGIGIIGGLLLTSCNAQGPASRDKAGGDAEPVVLTFANGSAGLYYNDAVQFF